MSTDERVRSREQVLHDLFPIQKRTLLYYLIRVATGTALVVIALVLWYVVFSGCRLPFRGCPDPIAQQGTVDPNPAANDVDVHRLERITQI